VFGVTMLVQRNPINEPTLAAVGTENDPASIDEVVVGVDIP